MILTFTGENSYEITAATRMVSDDFAKKHGANSVEVIDAEDLTPSRLPDLLQGATLFASARLVIIKNLAGNKAIQEPLAGALAKTAEDTMVVIADQSLDKRTKLYKFLKKGSEFKEFAPLSDSQLVAWVNAQAKMLGGQITPQAARHLLERCGRDQWRLSSELEKLVSYNPQISENTINIMTEPGAEGSAFELLDAAFAGQNSRVQKMLASLKNQEDPYKLFGLIASQAHVLAVVSAAGGRSADAIAKDAGLHPFVVRKSLGIAKKLGPQRIRQIAKDVALCDMQLKSTGADPWMLIRLCLQKIAQN